MKLFILIGASGAGKTVTQKYLVRHFHVGRVVTHTTRPKRPGEVDGKDYYFENERSWKQQDFFETNRFNGHWYGSSHQGLHRACQANPNTSIVLDHNGALRYKELFGDSVRVLWITPLSMDVLRQRLVDRDHNPSDAARRLAEYRDLLASTRFWSKDYPVLRPLIINSRTWPIERAELNELLI